MTILVRSAVLLAASAALCAPAMAQDAAATSGLYATFSAGGSFYSNVQEQTWEGPPPGSASSEMIMEPGIFVAGALGFRIVENLRGEFEVSYSTSSLAEMNGATPPADYENTAFQFSALGNLWYDLDTGTGLTPYLGGGIGIGYSEFHDDDDVFTATGVVYQLGAGVRTAVAENVTLDLGYRYRVLHDAPMTLDGAPPPAGLTARETGTNHIVQVGISFGF